MLSQSTQILINEIVIPLVGAGVVTVLEITRRQVKAFLDAHKAFIAKQEAALEKTIGTEQYNQDVALVKNTVKAVEQMGKEFNWEGTLKHSKVLELIEGKTGLTDDEIYNTIKAAVLEVNNMGSFSKATTK